MVKLLTFLICICTFTSFAQEVVNDSIPIDTKYKEDQFYIHVTYNFVRNVPDGVKLRGLSAGVGFGHIKDIPINKRRNVALGIGVGFTYNRYGQNLFIGENQDDTSVFAVLDGNTSYDINRMATWTAEVPFEFRWRSSTAETYKFWRVYAGVRVGYTYWYHTTFTQENNEVSQVDISEFQPLSFSPTFSFGFNKINFFATYTVTPFFKDAQTNSGEEVGFNPIKLGLIFYIL